MKKKPDIGHVTPVGANIFADLGFAPEDAKQYLAESNAIIARKRAIKERLMTEISTWIDQCQLTQVAAAQILGVTRPRVSDIVQKKSVKFTIDSLICMLTRVGKDVKVSVR
jgi:predicted XRE-type DNA-binding protein